MTGLDELRGYARRMNKLHVWPGGARLREIADQIEREHDAEVADSPYDAILPEDREAAAWVREHGGLDAVRSEWRSRVPYDKHERGRQRLLGHIAECETALGRRNGRIEELGHRVSGLTAENAELRRRAMPEGIEWPRFEDGEQVKIGDMVELNTVVAKVCGVFISKLGYVLHGESGENTGSDARFDYPNFMRAKRPKQEPVGADGLPIKKGDTVYLLPGEWCDEYPCLGYHGGEELEVFEDGEPEHVDGAVQCRDKKKGSFAIGTCYPQPHQLTHTKPDIMGADGQPLKVGDTVWDIEGGEHELVITSIELDELEHVKATQEEPTPANVSIHPSRLTHTKPEIDTWQRIEEDAGCTATKYNERRGTIFTTKQQVARDLVRRCRALAERERGE